MGTRVGAAALSNVDRRRTAARENAAPRRWRGRRRVDRVGGGGAVGGRVPPGPVAPARWTAGRSIGRPGDQRPRPAGVAPRHHRRPAQKRGAAPAVVHEQYAASDVTPGAPATESFRRYTRAPSRRPRRTVFASTRAAICSGPRRTVFARAGHGDSRWDAPRPYRTVRSNDAGHTAPARRQGHGRVSQDIEL